MPQQFPIIEAYRNNPILSGLKSGMDLYRQAKLTPLEIKQAQLSNLLNEQKQQEQEMYLQKYPEMLAAQLLKAKLEPEEMRARTSLIGSQQDETRARTSLAGSQQKELEQRLKYNPEIFSAEVAERRAKAEDITRKNQLIQKLLSGGGFERIGGDIDSVIQPNSINGNYNPGNDFQKEFSSMMGSPSGPRKMTYAQAALLSDQLGLPKPEVREIDGNLVGISAFGNFPIAQGMGAEEKAFKKELGSGKGKLYTELVNSYQGLSNQNTALDELISSSNDPEFRNVTGPVGSFLTKWGGTPERQRLLGNLQTASGEIALQVAPSLKGAFTGRDQTLINSIKANPSSDFPDVFIGKLKAQKLINNVLQERSEKAAQYLEQGYSQLQSVKKATQETPLDVYRKQVDNLIKPKKNINSNITDIKEINGKTYAMINGVLHERRPRI